MTPPAKKTPSKSVARVKKANSAAVLQEEQNALAMKAFQMRKAGASWWEIAENLKISEQQAGMLVHNRIKEAAKLVDEGTKRTMLAMEVDRLDTLQQAIWADAVGGDRQAIETALKIIQARAKVLGLETIPSSTVTNNTIVVAGTSEEYVAALKRVSELPIVSHEEM